MDGQTAYDISISKGHLKIAKEIKWWRYRGLLLMKTSENENQKENNENRKKNKPSKLTILLTTIHENDEYYYIMREISKFL